MILTSDLVTPIAARAPATFMQAAELRVWVTEATVQVELIAPGVSLPEGEHERLYDGGVFTGFGAELDAEAADGGARVSFTLRARTGETEARRSRPGASAVDPA
jgi:hypothetical protein